MLLEPSSESCSGGLSGREYLGVAAWHRLHVTRADLLMDVTPPVERIGQVLTICVRSRRDDQEGLQEAITPITTQALENSTSLEPGLPRTLR